MLDKHWNAWMVGVPISSFKSISIFLLKVFIMNTHFKSLYVSLDLKEIVH